MKNLLLLLFLFQSTLLFAQKATVKEEIDDTGEEFYETVEKINNRSLPQHSTTEWFKEMFKPRPNVKKAQKLYSTFVNKYPFYHSKNRRRFEVWMNNSLLNMDKNGYLLTYPQIKNTRSLLSANARAAGVLTASSEYVGSWKMIGPNNLDPLIGACGNNARSTGGFVDRPYINPYNTNNMLAGMSYGGLWVTQDAGVNWLLTDAGFANGTNTYANRDYYYGDIKANAINAQLVYSATEAGLLKSIDGGFTWTLCPLLNRDATPDIRPYYVAQSTNSQNIVLATFGRRLYRSQDGGVNWSVVFDNSAGGGNHRFTSQYNFGTPFGLDDRTYNFFGLEESYENPNDFFAGIWNAANEACIYKSTDGGITWNLLTNLNTSLSVAWDKSTSLILKTIAGSPTKFFVVPQFQNPSTYYRFNTSGSLASSNPINYETEAFGIDWTNENTIYISHYSSGYNGDDYVKKSLDGGVTIIDPVTGCGYLHADMRGISAVGNKVLFANDGGLGYTTDGGANIAGTGFHISATDIWGFSSSQRGDRILAGLDHNQTFIRKADVAGGWTNIKGGDAGPCSINPGDDHWLYYDWAYGVNKAYISDAGIFTEYNSASGIGYSSLAFHPYYLFNIFGINGTQIKQSSDNLSSISTFKDFGTDNNINKIIIARRDPKTMYALINNSIIKNTVDSGVTWQTVTPTTNQSSGQTTISAIEAGKLPGEIWATFANYQTLAKVLYSVDGGASWTNITGTGLPTEPVKDISYQRGTDGCVYIFINTLAGAQVWYKTNTMTAWLQLGNNLPTMGYLTDKMVVVPQKGVLRLGSSRGSWEQQLNIVSKPEASFSVENHIISCSAMGVQFHDASAFAAGNTSFLWTFPGGTPSTSTDPNPIIHYYGPSGAPGSYGVTLQVTDGNGNIDQLTANNIVQVMPNICTVDSVAGKAFNGYNTVTVLDTVPIKSNTFTICFWTKPNGLQKVFSKLIATNNPNTKFGIGISFPGYTNNLNLTFTSPDIGYGEQSDINLIDGVWNHIALTYSPTGVKIYLNGNEPWTYPINNARLIDFTQAAMYLNKDISGQGGNYNGDIDEVKFYNRVLEQNEIRETMNLINPIGEAGLVTYYQFNQFDPISNNLYEASGKAVTIIPAASITTSTAPIAKGVSQRIPAITAAGTYDFTTPGIALTFSDPTVPQGEIVISKLFSPASNPPSGYVNINSSYWVIRNYGTNQSFTPANMAFENVSISAADAATPSLLKIIKRPSTSFLQTDWGTDCGAANATAGANGTVTFDNTCNISSFSQFLLATNGTSPLPLTFLSFNAKAVNLKGVLNWVTANEFNNKKFVVQRSANSIDWKSVGAVSSKGNGGFNYLFTDNTPLNGVSFYRLQQVDIDGSFTYSTIKTISIAVEESIVIQPNPSNQYFLIKGCRTPLNEIKLYDIEGKNQRIVSVRQSENVVRIETASLPDGNYILMLRERGFKIIVLHK